MRLSIHAPCALLFAGVLATVHAQALPIVAQQTTLSPAATERAIGDAVNRDAVSAATEATNHWLAIVDAGKFADSWKNTAEVFKLGMPEAEWVVDLDAIRVKLGKTTMRELKTAQFSTTLRGAALTGQYVTISYLTKFALAPLAQETLVVSKEADGEWRIAGYNIGKAPDQ
jgi:predicted transcriptional regulator